MARKREDFEGNEPYWQPMALSLMGQNQTLIEQNKTSATRVAELERTIAELRGGAAAAASREWRAAGTPTLLAVGHAYRPQLFVRPSTCHHAAPADGTGLARARDVALTQSLPAVRTIHCSSSEPALCPDRYMTVAFGPFPAEAMRWVAAEQTVRCPACGTELLLSFGERRSLQVVGAVLQGRPAATAAAAAGAC